MLLTYKNKEENKRHDRHGSKKGVGRRVRLGPLTVISEVARAALTEETRSPVVANPAVETRLPQAFVDVLAGGPHDLSSRAAAGRRNREGHEDEVCMRPSKFIYLQDLKGEKLG